jgi:hypothetical protein
MAGDSNEHLGSSVGSSAFDILPRLLDIGCKIAKQDGEWWIFERGGNGVVSGKTFREMCEKLENVDIEDHERRYHDENCRRLVSNWNTLWG